MDCVLAIDQGTQSSRVFIYDDAARPVASHQVEFPQIYSQAGWCEHDPVKIIATVDACITGAFKAAQERFPGVDVNIKAVGITNQRETTIVWRRSTGKPCHNAIVWLDVRTSTYFSAFKVKWLYDNVPEVRDAMDTGDAMIGTVDSWLIYNLTGGVGRGVHVTDGVVQQVNEVLKRAVDGLDSQAVFPASMFDITHYSVTNASRTFLMDIRTRAWSPTCLQLFGIDERSLPSIRSNSEVYGHIAAGPLAGIPISGCLGDQQAAMLGQRCQEGQAKNTYGTGCFLLVHTGAVPKASSCGLLTTMAYQLGPSAEPQYALEGAIAVAGLGISWLRDNLGVLDSADASETLAAQVPDTGGVYFVPAMSGLLAPYWQDDARGVIVGITGFTDKRHIVRAMLEAMAFQTHDILQAVSADTGLRIEKLRVDGGATHNDLLMQIQADISQLPVQRPDFQETTSLGAAYAAGLAVGLYSRDQIFAPNEAAREFVPQLGGDVADKKYASWKKAVALSFNLADL